MSWETQTLSTKCQKAIADIYIVQIDQYIPVLPETKELRKKRDNARDKLRYMPWVNLILPVIVGIISSLAVYITDNLALVLINAIDAVPAALQKHLDSNFEESDSQLDIAMNLRLLRSSIEKLAQKGGLEKDSLKRNHKQLETLQKELDYGDVSFESPGTLIPKLDDCP